MNDKERILMIIARKYYSLSLRAKCKGLLADHEAFGLPTGEHLQPGDLVMGQTSRPNDFMIGYFVAAKGDSSSIIREIGTASECLYTNEKFIPIKGIHHLDLLDCNKYKLLNKIHKAFRKTRYYTRFKNLIFEGDRAVVSARQAFEDTEIFSISFGWSRQTTIKSIAKLLIEKEEMFLNDK